MTRSTDHRWLSLNRISVSRPDRRTSRTFSWGSGAWRTALIAALVLSPANVGKAVTRNWEVGNGLWTGLFGLGTNWNPDGVPAGGDIVRILFNDSTSRTVTYDYTGSPVTLSELYVDGAFLAPSTLSMSANNLTSTYELIGEDRRGILDQSGGTNTIAAGGALYVGDLPGSTGLFNLSNSGSLVANGHEYIGTNGTGTLNQTGGSNTTNGTKSLFVGYSPGAVGNYSLTGTGSLSVSGNENIGLSGTGSFTQSAGTNTLSLDMVVGFTAGALGTYTMTGGTFSTGGTQYIGYSATGGGGQAGGSKWRTV